MLYCPWSWKGRKGRPGSKARRVREMTKKHFVAMANAVKFSTYDTATKVAVAKTFADVAKSFNGRFDADKFYAAAGVADAVDAEAAAARAARIVHYGTWA